MKHPIYIGTVLLEPNRWMPGKPPTIRVGDWFEAMAAAGFDGIELWENHARLLDAESRRISPLPIAVLNSYAACDDSGRAARDEATRQAVELDARAIKFNLGPDSALRETYATTVRQWLDSLPSNISLLCECHPGTVMEDPAAAARYFEAFDSPRVKAIIHPLGKPVDELRRWFQCLGPERIAHAHIQLRDAADNPIRLDREPERVKETLTALAEEGFTGSFTIEFTEGVGNTPEDVQELWQNAAADLNLLREMLQ